MRFIRQRFKRGRQLTYHHLVHSSFPGLSLCSVHSLTFPLVLPALLVLVLFFGLGAFWKKVVRFDI